MPATSTVCRVFSGSPPRQGLGLGGALLRTNSAESPSSSDSRRIALLSFRLARLKSARLLAEIVVGQGQQRIELTGFGTFHAATSSPQRSSSAPPSAVIARRIE